MHNKITYLFLLVFIGIACQKAETEVPSPKEAEPLLLVPAGFPEPAFPEDNPFSEAAWELGKRLFYDVRLSNDRKVSCASCHHPQKAFSDTVAFSRGFDQLSGTRNAPSLANVGYHPYFTREGGVPTLEMQVLVPVQEHTEFNSNILEIAELLSSDSVYQELSEQAYGREIDYYVIPRAIATFERSLISGNSKYDQYLNGTANFSELENEGLTLFESSRTNCASCHSGFNFTNYGFTNNGLYAEYDDSGRFRLTGEESDRAVFKVPSLRNVELTGPYMHDGSISKLEEVIDHYNTGGKQHANKSPLIRPMSLSNQEKQALLAFLKTLTDENFVNNEKFRP